MDVSGACDGPRPSSSKENSWRSALSQLKDGAASTSMYSKLWCRGQWWPSACCICDAMAVAISRVLVPGTGGGAPLLLPLEEEAASVCTGFTLSIPKAEHRLPLVRETLGQACVNFLQQERTRVARAAEGDDTLRRLAGDEKVSFSSRLCDERFGLVAVCPEGRTTTVAKKEL